MTGGAAEAAALLSEAAAPAAQEQDQRPQGASAIPVQTNTVGPFSPCSLGSLRALTWSNACCVSCQFLNAGSIMSLFLHHQISALLNCSVQDSSASIPRRGRLVQLSLFCNGLWVRISHLIDGIQSCLRPELWLLAPVYTWLLIAIIPAGASCAAV